MAVFKSLISSLIEVVFPVDCFGCGRRGMYCCADCLSRAVPRTIVHAVGDSVVHSAYPYADAVVRRHIHDFKYLNSRIVRPGLEALLERWALVSGQLIPEECVLVPVPLHEKKRQSRGFNQAEELALMLGALLDLPVENGLLFRVRGGPSQTKTEDRTKNVSDAFRARTWSGGRVFLVDDVMTSGATLSACMDALADAGALCVGGFVLARGDRKKAGKP